MDKIGFLEIHAWIRCGFSDQGWKNKQKKNASLNIFVKYMEMKTSKILSVSNIEIWVIRPVNICELFLF